MVPAADGEAAPSGEAAPADGEAAPAAPAEPAAAEPPAETAPPPAEAPAAAEEAPAPPEPQQVGYCILVLKVHSCCSYCTPRNNFMSGNISFRIRTLQILSC